MSGESERCSREDAMSAMEASAEADPRTNPFGVYASDAFVGGAAAFQWFENADRLFVAIAVHFPLLFCDEDDAEVTASILDVLSRFPGESRFGPKCLGLVSAALDGIQELYWVGRFEDLVSGDSEFARDLRSQFRMDDSEDDADADAAQASPLDRSEIDGFVEWLRHRGH